MAKDPEEQNEDKAPITDRAAGSTMKGAGKVEGAAGKTVEGTGRAVQASGKAVEGAGRGVQAPGKGVEASGKVAKQTGKAVGKAGDGLTKAGTELSGTGYGAIAGVPMAVVGGTMSATGKATAAAGTAAETGGKAAAKAGEKTAKAGKKTAEKGKGTAHKGKKMSAQGRQLQQRGDQMKEPRPSAAQSAKNRAGAAIKKGRQIGQALNGDARALAQLTMEEGRKKARTAITVGTIIVAVVGSLLMVSMFGSTMTVLGTDSGEGEKSEQAAGVNGVEGWMVDSISQRTESTKVPWQIIAAINKTAAYEEDAQGWGGFDQEELADNYPDLAAAVTKGDNEYVINWLTKTLDLSVDGHAGKDLALDTGADASGMDVRYINDVDPASAGPAQRVQRVWTTALETLPLAGNPERATTVYLVARAWALGNYVNECVLGGVQNVSATSGSGWANPADGPITSPYGTRRHPVFGTVKLHDGTDIGAPTGTPVYAANSGTAHVVSAAAYGNHFVTIDHGDGLQTQYGHMSASSVTDGQQVQAGEKVGEVGSQGYSTGAHLHFIVRQDGTTTDPVPFMAERGIDLGKTPAGQVVGATPSDTTNASDTTSGGLGVMPTVTSVTGSPATGTVTLSSANVKVSYPDSKFASTVRALAAKNPDFITFNEVSSRTVESVSRHSGGKYEAYRVGSPDPTRGGGAQSMGNMVAWRTDTWSKVAGGRVKIVDDDQVIIRSGARRTWDRYATWVVLKSRSGQLISVLSTHHMTNPFTGDHQWGNQSFTRAEQYGKGMDILANLVRTLSSKGPVLVGGDMNSHPNNGSQAAASKMQNIGYGFTKTDVMYNFYPKSQGAKVLNEQTISRGSLGLDHNVLITKIALTGGSDDSTSEVSTTAGLPETWEGSSATGEKVTLDRTQLGFAQQVFQVGRQMGVSNDGIIIAFMVALVESKGVNAATGGKAFNNYASPVYPETVGMEYPQGAVHADSDSVGLFQQRPQAGWGAPRDLMDPEKSAAAFYGGPNGPNGGSPMGLLDHTGWESRPKGDVAQDVQVSAHPDRYAAWESAATQLLSVVAGAAPLNVEAECATNTDFTGGFTVATYNILGWGHTTPGGSKGNSKYASGSVRFPAAMEALESHNVSIAALQEMHQQNQMQFRDGYSSEWGACKGNQDFVIWRKSEWNEVQCGRVQIPYFGGRKRTQPFVLLEQVGTGQKLWFMGIHNPANARGPARTYRRQGLDIELAAIKDRAQQGYPVFIAGDFNDFRDGNDRAQCVLTPFMTNAFGASATGCEPPPGDPRVDHIYSHGVTLAEAAVDKSGMGRISDHPLVTAVVPSQTGSGDCTPDSSNPITAAGTYTANAVKISDCMFGSFGQYISSIGGYRTSSRSGNHETGCALDIMIANWDSAAGAENGDKIAKWLQDNAEAMGIQYLIWRQRIWSVPQAGAGWRPMSDRGSPTQNHMDHVHVSVHGPKCVKEV